MIFLQCIIWIWSRDYICVIFEYWTINRIQQCILFPFSSIKNLSKNEKEECFDFFLLNCKKPSFKSNNLSYTKYANTIVDTIYFQNNWIVHSTSENSVPSSSAYYKNALQFIKDNIDLETLYNKFSIKE